jgi:hypothetical protein
MSTARVATIDGQRRAPKWWVWARLAATVLIATAVAWLLYEYNAFGEMDDRIDVFVIAGRDPRPLIFNVVRAWRLWLLVGCATVSLGVLIYIWKSPVRILPFTCATLSAATFCALIAGIMRIASIEAWHWYVYYSGHSNSARETQKNSEMEPVVITLKQIEDLKKLGKEFPAATTETTSPPTYTPVEK